MSGATCSSRGSATAFMAVPSVSLTMSMYRPPKRPVPSIATPRFKSPTFSHPERPSHTVACLCPDYHNPGCVRPPSYPSPVCGGGTWDRVWGGAAKKTQRQRVARCRHRDRPVYRRYGGLPDHCRKRRGQGRHKFVQWDGFRGRRYPLPLPCKSCQRLTGSQESRRSVG